LAKKSVVDLKDQVESCKIKQLSLGGLMLCFHEFFAAYITESDAFQ